MIKEEVKVENNFNNSKTYSQEQVHDIIFSREIEWQEIIYDLINTEQLDPWDVDISVLTDKFLKKIEEYDEMDFFISSKVLLAASLLLRIKSEFLLNKYVRNIDEILFGKKEKQKIEVEKIYIDGNIPTLIPKTPLPRFKKVSLKELIDSLNKAIITENRRIKKEILNTNALRETGISLPKRKFNITDKLKEIHEKIVSYFSTNKDFKKITYTSLIGKDKEERIASFFPLLQLENNKKIWLEQEKHFDEIHIWLKEVFFKENPNFFADLFNKDFEKELEEIDSLKDAEKLDEINEENKKDF
jgi:segregation and condensation protein A